MAVAVAAYIQYYHFSGFDGPAPLNLLLLVAFYAPFFLLIVRSCCGKMELTIDDSELRIDTWHFSKTIPLRSIAIARLSIFHRKRIFRVTGSGMGEISWDILHRERRGVRFSYFGGTKTPEELLRALCERREGC